MAKRARSVVTVWESRPLATSLLHATSVAFQFADLVMSMSGKTEPNLALNARPDTEGTKEALEWTVMKKKMTLMIWRMSLIMSKGTPKLANGRVKM
jgi:hypothetical protein